MFLQLFQNSERLQTEFMKIISLFPIASVRMKFCQNLSIDFYKSRLWKKKKLRNTVLNAQDYSNIKSVDSKWPEPTHLYAIIHLNKICWCFSGSPISPLVGSEEETSCCDVEGSKSSQITAVLYSNEASQKLSTKHSNRNIYHHPLTLHVPC